MEGERRWSRPGLWGVPSEGQAGGVRVQLEQCFSSRAVSGDIFGVTTKCGATVVLWVEARDIAKRSTMHRTAPTMKDLLAQEVTCAEVAKPCACHFCVVVAVSVLFMAGPLVPGL